MEPNLYFFYSVAVVLALTLFSFKYIALIRVKNIALKKIGLKTKSNKFLMHFWSPICAVSIVVYWNLIFFHIVYFVNHISNFFLIMLWINTLLIFKTFKNWKIFTAKIKELKNLNKDNYKIFFKYAKPIINKNLIETLAEIEITNKLSFKVFNKNKVYTFAWFGKEMFVRCENRKTKLLETENKFYNFKDFQKSLS